MFLDWMRLARQECEVLRGRWVLVYVSFMLERAAGFALMIMLVGSLGIS